MCLIVVAVAASARYRLLVAANRDEQHARPTQPAAWWPDAPHVLGGRDLSARGTWLAVDDRGRFAAVTNIRDPQRPLGLRSRGSLVADYLGGNESAARYAALASRDGPGFGAFNLVLFDGRELYFAGNRAPAVRLDTGLHAFSNAPPGTEWPKTTSALRGAEPLLAQATPVEPLFALLAARDEAGAPERRHERAHFVVGPTYGTRCSTVVLVGADGVVTFAERSFDTAGLPAGEVRESFTVDG
jgi:uncharacterized protein with NRDE domain